MFEDELFYPMEYDPTMLMDLYQLTMAQAYFENKMEKQNAVFHLFFRKAPFGGRYAVAAGLEQAIAYLEGFGTDGLDAEYLRNLTGVDGKELFTNNFLSFLSENIEAPKKIDAIPEGTVVFPTEPILRVEGSIIFCQLVETALLNMINFQTLIATKAARICQEAGDDMVLEFGARRAQGIDGALSASRAAYIGGCHATSNVLAGAKLGIPVRGTHAHSWVMCHKNELDSFLNYGRACPNNVILLVDTYDTMTGIDKAIEAGKQLEEVGITLLGIRLDSGDLGKLSIIAREKLDSAGFNKAIIVASDDLDEFTIKRYKDAGARIDCWGVGTNLVTGGSQSALGGVYKLASIERDGAQIDVIKLSDSEIKTSNPGPHTVYRRFTNDGQPQGDIIAETDHDGSHLYLTKDETVRELLVPIFREGECIYESPELPEIRKKCIGNIKALPEKFRKIEDPSEYPVMLERSLREKKREMIQTLRGHHDE